MSTSQQQLVRVDATDNKHVAEIVLCNPKKLNSMTDAFFSQFHAAIVEVDAMEHVRVCVIHAEGRMFSCGLDLGASAEMFGKLADGSSSKRSQFFIPMVRAWQNAFDLARTSDTVFICAMHGKTIGGAIDLCTGADIRVCDKSAAFSVAEVKLAIVADLGTLQRLGRVVGHGRARHWALTGEFVGSEEALQAGLVTKVYEDYAAMMKGVRTMAHSIATYSPRVLKGIKSTLNYSEDHSVQEGLEYVAHYNSHSLCEEDVAEATTAFFSRRQPKYPSKL